jgi:hypothetical protein
MSSLVDKAVRLGIGLLVAVILMREFLDRCPSAPGDFHTTPGAVAAGASLLVLGFIGQRWATHRLDVSRRPPERKPFIERRRVDPPLLDAAEE